jgi:hypothetical protein
MDDTTGLDYPRRKYGKYLWKCISIATRCSISNRSIHIEITLGVGFYPTSIYVLPYTFATSIL